MTAQLAVHGRLGRDPRPIETGSGKPMTVASIAVSVEARESGETGEGTLWLDVLAFGRVADDLARHVKGDTVSVAGRLQLSRFTSSTTGEARENWQCVADSVISARTVRPAGGRRSGSEGCLDPARGAPWWPWWRRRRWSRRRRSRPSRAWPAHGMAGERSRRPARPGPAAAHRCGSTVR